MNDGFTSSEQALVDLLAANLQCMTTRSARQNHILHLVIAADRAHVLARETPEQFVSRALWLYGGKGRFGGLADSRLAALQKAVCATLLDRLVEKKATQPGQAI